MKKILLFITLLFLLMITRVNASVLTYEKEYKIDNIDTIIELNDSYYAVSDNLVIKYNNNLELEATKLLEDTHSSKIIKYMDNILLIGNKNNFINIYLLNQDLQVLNSVETTIIFYYPNMYYYDSNVYLLLGEDYILEDTNMYKIDSNLQITTNSISSYGDQLKNIIKSDYYAFNNQSISETIKVTTYNKDFYVLAGTDFLRLLDLKGNIVKEIPIQSTILDLLFLNNKILSLTNDAANIYSLDLELEDSIEIDNSSFYFWIKSKDRVLIKTSNDYLKSYLFNIKINVIESDFGTVEIEESAQPNTNISYKILPNSGYEIDSVMITDEYGNDIKTNGESFITPSSAVYIMVNYKADVINPETLDLIALIISVSLVALLVFVKLYKKFKWINN